MGEKGANWIPASGRGELLFVLLLLSSGVLAVIRWVSPGLTLPEPEPLWLLIVRSGLASVILLWAFLPNAEGSSDEPGGSTHTMLGIPIKWLALALAALIAWTWFARQSG